MSKKEKWVAADLWLTCQQILLVISAWVYYIGTAFTQCGEVVLKHADKENNSNPVSFHTSFPSQ